MKLSQFKFKLPDELIAQYPAEERDESRLMVLHRNTGEIEHKIFKDILDYFNEGDLLVLKTRRFFLRVFMEIKRKRTHGLKYSCCAN